MNLSRRQIEARARTELARRRFDWFVKTTAPAFQIGWAHQLIFERLQAFYKAVADGRSPRLMVNTPPRFGKSWMISQLFPAWLFGQDPTLELIVASYAMTLPVKFSRRIREQIRFDATYQSLFPETKLNPDIQSAEEWETSLGGSFRPTGRATGLSGRGAHVLIVDDLIASAEEADSDLIREQCWDWYTSVAYTRLYPGAGVIVVATRWHPDDLSARLLQLQEDDPDADQWEHLSLPALAEQHEFIAPGPRLIQVDDPADAPPEATPVRSPGQALHPERFSEKHYRRIKATLPPRHWAALYQQSPVPETGPFFSTSSILHLPRPDVSRMNVVITLDTAASQAEGASESAITVLGLPISANPQAPFWLMEAVYGRHTTKDVVHILLDLFSRWNETSRVSSVGIETGPISHAVKPWLMEESKRRGVYLPLADEAVMRPFASKEVRARPLQGLIESSRLAVPTSPQTGEPPVWWTTVLRQLDAFPSGRGRNDLVDALAWAVRLALPMVSTQAQPQKSRVVTLKERLTRAYRQQRGGGKIAKTFMGA